MVVNKQASTMVKNKSLNISISISTDCLHIEERFSECHKNKFRLYVADKRKP